MIVAMAVVTTMAMPPTLRWALARLPMRKEEKQRLEREEMEAKGFVPNLERLLLAVDDSANGKFATRIAAMLAGHRGMPTTVMQIKTDKKTGKAAAAAQKEKAKEAGQTVKDIAEQSRDRAAAGGEKAEAKARRHHHRRKQTEAGSGRRRSQEGLRPDDHGAGKDGRAQE